MENEEIRSTGFRYTEDNVTFTSVKNPSTLVPNVLGRRGRWTSNGESIPNIDNEKTLINAVDIDWNGIEVDNNTLINTTADLINYIKSKEGQSSTPDTPLNQTISYTISCYRWYKEDITNPIAPKDDNNLSPEANDYLNSPNQAFPETKWAQFAPNRPTGNNWILWLSCSEITKNLNNNTYSTTSWQPPFQITGATGTAGEDNFKREYIYKRFTNELTFGNNNNNPAYWAAQLQDDYSTGGWGDNPQGVTEQYPFEYCAYRTKENGSWGKFSTPNIWSHYGINGTDGDGIEYVFVRTSVNKAPFITIKSGDNLLEDEYRPIANLNIQVQEVNSNQLNQEKEYISGGPDYPGDNFNGYSQVRCSDNPIGVDDIYRFEWVLLRKKKNGVWQSYININPDLFGVLYMSLWAVRGQDGKGDSISIVDGEIYINGTGTGVVIDNPDGTGVTIISLNNLEQRGLYIGQFGNFENHLYVWNGTEWISLGETTVINGDGESNPLYGHVAYADSIIYNNGQITYKGFTKDSSSIKKNWIGIVINSSNEDPGPDLNSPNNDYPNGITSAIEGQGNGIELYKWQFAAGKDGNGFEFIYCLTLSGVTPEISDEYKTGPNGEIYPKVKIGNNIITSSNNNNRIHSGLLDLETYYWTDDPVSDVTEQYPILWWANRRFINNLWTNFRSPNKIDEWKENSIAESSIPFYKWWNNTVPSAPSIPTSALDFRTIAHNEGWSDSSSIPSPYPSDSSYKFYSCIATLRNGVFYQWGPVEEVSSPNVQVVNGKSPFQLICYPSAINIRATSVGDFIDNIYKINCSVIQGESVIASSSLTTGGYHIYYRKTYTNAEDAWSSLTSNNNLLYQISFLTDFGGTVTDGNTTYNCTGATGISKEVTNKGYLKAIEFCLSSANSGDIVSASNTLASITVPITCDGQKGASSSSVGLNGTSTYIIKLYRKLSSSEISALTSGNNGLNDSHPNLNIYYDFTDNKIYSGSTNGSIVTQVLSYDSGPSNSKYWYLNKDDAANFEGDLYVTVASAITTDTSTRVQILSSLWSTPVPYTDSLNTATIFLYKRSSTTPNARPSGLFTYNFLSKSFDWTDPSGLGQLFNGWNKTIPSGTNPCYIIQATACSATNIDYIDGSEFSDPVLYVKNGDPGQSITGPKGDTGKMFFSMGVWDKNETYVLDALKIPMVFYNDGEWNEALGCNGSYYYLNPEYTQGSTGDIPGDENSVFGDNNDKKIWIKTSNFGVVITQGIFAEFAKFGSAIMSGDYMFSTNGKFNELDVVAGDKLGNKPCYLFFNNENKNYEVTETLTQTLTPDNGGSNTKLYTYNGSKLYLKQITIDLNSETTQCNITNILNNNIYSSTSGKTNGITTFTVNKWIETGYKIKFTSYQSSISNAFNLNLIVSGDFVPNWMVDLKSGEMIASQGNFKLNADGTINAAKGNFIIDANGNVSVEGTIKAKNLYREIYINDKEETYYYYCIKVPESSDTNSFGDPAWTSSESNYIPFNYTVGEYYKNNEIDNYWKEKSYYDSNSDSYINYLTKCTGYADFVILPSTSNDASQNENQVYDIILPDPSDFPNKVIEINDYRYVLLSSNYHLPTTYAKCVVPGNKMMNRIDDTITTNLITLVTGSANDVLGRKHTLISYGECWVKLNYGS